MINGVTTTINLKKNTFYIYILLKQCAIYIYIYESATDVQFGPFRFFFFVVAFFTLVMQCDEANKIHLD